MIGDDVNETMNMPMGPERARVMLRQAVQLARLAYEECVQLGLDADIEYAQAVDEAEAQAEKGARARALSSLSGADWFQPSVSAYIHLRAVRSHLAARGRMKCSTLKPGYTTQEIATRAAIVASKRTGLTLSVYSCPDCKQWHLTKSVGGANAPVTGRRKRAADEAG